MRGALQSLTVLLPTLYALCAILHGMAFGGVRAPQVSGLRRFVVRATIAVHIVYFWLRGEAVGHFPVADLWTTVSAVALATAFLYAGLARHLKHPGTGGVVLGLVLLLQLLASSFGTIEPIPRAGGMGPFQVLHVSTSVLAAAAVLLSGIHGALYLVLFRELRERRFGALFDHLPDLDWLATMTRRSALAGFVGLTIGLNIGLWMAHRAQPGQFDYRASEVMLSLILWIHFGVVAFSGVIRGFGARRTSIAATVGLVVLLLSPILILFPGRAFHSGV